MKRSETEASKARGARQREPQTKEDEVGCL